MHEHELVGVRVVRTEYGARRAVVEVNAERIPFGGVWFRPVGTTKGAREAAPDALVIVADAVGDGGQTLCVRP
jgi:hypothetical protein